MHRLTVIAPGMWRQLAHTLNQRIPHGALLATHSTVDAARTAGDLRPGTFVVLSPAALTAIQDPTDTFIGMSGALVYTDPSELTADTVAALALAGLTHVAQLPDAAEWLTSEARDYFTATNAPRQQHSHGTAEILAIVAREARPYNAPGGVGIDTAHESTLEPRHAPLGLTGRARGWNA